MANYQDLARRYAKRYGIDPNLFVRQIQSESGFDPRAHSGAGAIGIAQIMPDTARGWGVDPNDPKASLRAAAQNMSRYVKKYGSFRNALVAYNAGPAAVGRRSLPKETTDYISKIMGGSDLGSPSAPVVSQRDDVSTIPGITSGTSTALPGSNLSSIIDTYTRATRQSPIMLPGASATPFPFAGQQALPNSLAATIAQQRQQLQSSSDLTNSMIQNLIQLQSKPYQPADTGAAPQGDTTAPEGGKGTADFEGTPVAGWIATELDKARKAGWTGTVSSGFRTYAKQKEIYDSGVRPAAKPGTSNHEGAEWPRGAVDVTNPEQLSKILRRLKSPLVWAGSKDPVHFSHPHGGSY